MPLSIGDKLGPYEILAPIGKGGMGEVYRAHDSRLNRDVAIKVSAAQFSERFEREAKAIAALNHPNICQIYDVGPNYLVMEFIEGESPKGPLPLDEALRIARQIADALEAAHDKGITHRDLKPGNIKIKPDGTVKVLDFGLAKVTGGPASSGENSPTLTMGMTQAGMILGTASYMAPEQARGQESVDKRADIWAFGVVLHELLTGKRLFQGDDVGHTLAAVIMQEPDLSGVTAQVLPLLKRCLEKDPKKRLRDIGDAWLLLDAGQVAGLDSHEPKGRIHGLVLRWAAGLLLLVTLGISFVHFREVPPVAQLMRFQIQAPEKAILGNSLSLSPDGRRLAFPARGADGVAQIWVRSLDTLAVRPLPGTEGVVNNGVGNSDIFWSPDSRFIGFAVQGKVKRVEASGGPAQTVCDLPNTFRGGAWAPDGTIIFGASYRPLMRVPETGGVPVPLTALAGQEGSHGHPSFLPDGRHFVYERGSSGNEKGGIYLGSLDAKPEMQDSKRLASSLAPRYAPSPDPGFGYVLFGREGSLMALPFDARRLEPAGAAVPVAEGLLFTGSLSYSASATGVLAFRTGPPGGTGSQLLWFDRQGKQLGPIGPPAPYGNLQLSPDGKLLLVDQGTQHLWVADLARGVFSRVNPGDTTDYVAAVSPDGRVAFTFALGGALGDIYVRLASGAGAPELLVKSATQKHPNHWSLDGRFLIYDDHTTQQQDLWIVPMTGDRKPIPFLVTPADETSANFSPDTKWIVYSSDESGRREVYVQGFVPDHVPAAGVGKWQISTAGGDKPRWRRDGKELYYIAPDGKMMAVPIKSTATTFEPGIAIPLFETHVTGFMPYDVAPDGRFLINTVMENAAANTSPITVVLNWTAGLKK
jgi:Tol biopolymer transport system component/predicted Ser/Thr protein kinase